MFYTIREAIDENLTPICQYYVSRGTHLEGGDWHTDPREFLSAEEARIEYEMTEGVRWSEPDADADPDVVLVGEDGQDDA